MKLHRFMTTTKLVGKEFSGPSWSTWRVIARLIDGDAHLLNAEERELALRLTGRTKLPDLAPREVYIGAGRRAGKSRFESLVATWLAAQEYPQLATGETAVVAHVAPDRRQAAIDLDYARGLAEASPLLRAELTNATQDGLEFRHRTRLEVATASYRTVRGRTLAGAVIDESAFLRSEDSALPDIELARALRPALLTLNGLLLVVSSPHRKVGLLYTAHRKYFGNDEATRGLYIQAASRDLNPTLDEAAIADAMEDDPTAGRSEFLGQFREDISAYLTEELIEASLPGRLGRGERRLPVGFVDMSGGVADSSVLGIAHAEDVGDPLPIVRLDALHAVDAPHEPATVVERFAAVLRDYGLHRVTGDRYAAAWCSGAFEAAGIHYEPVEQDKSAIYDEGSRLFAERRVELIEDTRLLTQLRLLERRARPGGRPDAIDHPPRSHDDSANAAVGALVLAARGEAPTYFSRRALLE